MITALTALPTPLLILVVVGICVGATLLGIWIVRKRLPVDTAREHNDVAGFIFAIVGVMYAVVLAFLAIAVWEQYSDSDRLVQTEASGLSALYRDAEAFQNYAELRTLQLQYAHALVEDEWPQMARQGSSERADTALNGLFRAYRTLDPHTSREVSWYGESLKRLNDLETQRAIRLASTSQSLPNVIWGVLLLGAVITVGYTVLYGLRSFTIHALLSSSLAATVGLILVIIIALDLPFTGDTSIAPTPFQDFIHEAEMTR